MMAPQPGRGWQEVTVANALLSGLNDLSSRAGHDMLGALNQAASLLALFLKRHENSPDPQAATLLEFLQSSSSRIEGVLAGFRRYLEIASKPPRFESVDLNASLASSLALLETQIVESGAIIVLGQLPVVSADSAQMVAIFEILIGNAIKFHRPDAPPRIQVSLLREGIREELREGPRAGDLLCISVADNGIGIDPQYCETALLPFKRLNGAQYPGAGLGLAVAKLIAEMHGGQIRINPERKKYPGGTEVLFTAQPASDSPLPVSRRLW
jgi:light-regulated signal transduction histidine kinase (bacteriophytochrome)